MRRKRSWVVWCVVVALALLALAVPALQAQGRLASKPIKTTGCTFKDETDDVGQTGFVYLADATVTIYTDNRTGVAYKVVCRGTLPSYDAALVPKTWDGDWVGVDCDYLATWNWTETINRKGRVTLTCYR